MSGFGGGGGSGGGGGPGVATTVEIASQAQTYARTPYLGVSGKPLVPSITRLLVGQNNQAFFNVAADGAVAGLGLKSLDVQGNRGGNKASGNYSVAVGFNCNATTSFSCAVGYSCATTANNALAFGGKNTSSGLKSSAFGYKNIASYAGASAFGYFNTASGFSCAFGNSNTSSALYSNAFGTSCTASNTNASAFGYLCTASGVGSSAFGSNALARIATTTVIQGPIIAPKTGAVTQPNAFSRLSGVQDILWTVEIDFTAAGATYTFTLPAGAVFFIDEVGVIVEELDGSVTTQPTYSFGITGTNNKYLNAIIGANLGTLLQRDKYSILKADVGETSLTFTITVSGVRNTATVYKGKAYLKGMLIELEP